MKSQGAHSAVIDYIKEATALGMSRKDIKNALADFNFTEDEIDDLLRETDRLAFTAQSQGPAKPQIYTIQAKSQASNGSGAAGLYGGSIPKIAKSKSRTTQQKKVSYLKYLLAATFAVLFIILGLTAVYFYDSNVSTINSVDQLLPYDTYWYLKINTDLNSQQHQQLRNLYARLPYADNMPQALNYLLALFVDKGELDNLYSRYQSSFNELSQITLALTNKNFLNNASQNFNSSLVILGEKLSDEKIAEFVILLKTDKNLVVSESKIQGHKVYRVINKNQDGQGISKTVNLENLDCYIAFVDNTMALAFEQDNLQGIISLYKAQSWLKFGDADQQNLSQNIDYLDIVQKLARPNLLESYLSNISLAQSGFSLLSDWNRAALGSLLADQDFPISAVSPETLEAQVVRATQDSLKIDSVLWDSKKSSKFSAEYLKKDSLANLMPQKLSGNYINLYIEGNDLQLTYAEIEDALQQLQSEAKNDADARKIYSDLANAGQMLSQYISLDIENDLLPHFKGNFCLLVAPATNAQKPSAALVVNAKDAAILGDKLSHMQLDPNSLKEFIYTVWFTFFERTSNKYVAIAESDLPAWDIVDFEAAEYQGHAIYTTQPLDLVTPILDDLMFFNYAVVSDKLIVANTESALKDIVLSLTTDQPRLVNNQYFRPSYNTTSDQLESFWWQYLEGWNYLLEYGILDYYNNLESDLKSQELHAVNQLQQITKMFSPLFYALKTASAYYVTDGKYQKNYLTLNIQKLSLEEEKKSQDMLEMFFNNE